MKRRLSKYAYVPLACVFVLNMFAFYGTRLFTSGGHHYSVTLAADLAIPLYPPAVVIYMLAWLSWVVGFYLIARDGEDVCYDVLSGEMIAKLITTVCFLALPTTMTRPEVTGDDLFSQLVKLIYVLDTPDNLFPSVHCLENWIIFRGLLKCRHVSKACKWGSGVFALLVFASTLLVKQHLLLDVIGAVVIGEIGLLLGRKLRAGRVLRRLNARLGLTSQQAG